MSDEAFGTQNDPPGTRDEQIGKYNERGRLQRAIVGTEIFVTRGIVGKMCLVASAV